MTLKTVKNSIEKKIVNKTFTFNADDYQSEDIKNMVLRFGIGKKFSVHGAKLNTENGHTVVSGTIEKFLQARDPKVMLKFSEIKGATDLTIEVSAFPNEWVMSDIFPSLKGSIFSELIFREPTFLISSHPDDTVTDNFQVAWGYPVDPEVTVVKGLSFTGKLMGADLPENVGLPLGLTGGKASLIMKGPIVIKDDKPVFWIQSQEAASLKLLSSDLLVRLNLISLYQPGVDANGAFMSATLGKLTSQINAGGSSVPISGSFTQLKGGMINVKSELTTPLSLSLKDAANLIGQSEITLPISVRGKNSFQLEKVGFLMAGKTVLDSILTARVDKKWELLDGLFTLENVRFHFVMSNPQDKKQKSFRLTSLGEISIGGGKLETRVQMPDMTFSANLVRGDYLDLSAFVRDTLKVDLPMPSMKCTALSMQGNLSKSSYSFYTFIKSEWAIQVANTQLMLNGVELRVDYEDKKLTLDIACTTRIGALLFSVKGQYNSQDKSWTFTGRLPNSLSLTNVMREFAALLNMTIPADLPDLTVSNLTMSFNTRSRDIQISGSSPDAFNISKTIAVTGISISLSRNASVSNMSLEGYISMNGKNSKVQLIVTGGNEIALIMPDPITFPDLDSTGNFFGDSINSLFPAEVSFPATLTVGDIILKYDLKAKKLSAYSIEIASPGAWEVIAGFLSVTNMEWDINAANLTGPNAKSLYIAMEGQVNILGTPAQLQAIKDMNGWTIRGSVSTGTKSLKELVQWFIPDYDLLNEIPLLTFDTITFEIAPGEKVKISARSKTSWKFDLGTTTLNCESLSLGFSRVKAGKKWKSKGSFGCKCLIGDTWVDLAVDFPGKLVLDAKVRQLSLKKLIDAVGARELLKGLDFPDALLNIELQELDFDLDLVSKKIQVAAKTRFGDVFEFFLGKVNNKWGLAIGLQLTNQFRFSNLIPDLKQLDGLSISHGYMMLATFGGTTTFQKLGGGQPANISPGLIFYTSLSLAGLGADQLLGVPELNASANIGSKVSEIRLACDIAGNIPLGSGIVMKSPKFILSPSKTNFSIVLQGAVDVKIDNDTLTFVGGLDVGPNGANFFATMPDTWTDPFKVKGLTATDVALTLGVSFQGLPTVGLAGSIAVAKYKASLAVKFDAANPARSLLSFALNRLPLSDLFGAVVDTNLTEVIPKETIRTLMDAEFTDVQFYVAPIDTTIGTLFYKQGLSIQAKMKLWGLNGKAALLVDYKNGIKLDAIMDPINIGGMLKVHGAERSPNPQVHIEIAPLKAPDILISGRVEVMGISRSTLVKISDTLFYIKIEGSLFGIVNCSLEVQGGSLNNSKGIMVAATVQDPGYFGQLATGAARAIHAAAEDASAAIKKNIQEVDAAQAQVNSLVDQVEVRRNQVRNERAAVTSAFNYAMADVANKQQSVDSLQATINNKEREKAYEGSRTVSTTVPVYWKPTPTWTDPFRGYWVYSTFSVPDPAGVANAARLQTELVGLYAAINSARIALSAAHGTLAVARAAVNFAPIDADPTIVSLFAAHVAATASLNTYKDVLNTTRVTLGGIADVSEFIARNGMNQLVQIHSAHFKGALDNVNGGSVNLQIDLTLKHVRRQFGLDLNIKDPVSTIDALGKKLVKDLM